MELILKLIERAKHLMDASLKVREYVLSVLRTHKLRKKVRDKGDWDYPSYEGNSGCFNCVKVVGNFAIRVCQEDEADPSWGWLEYCYKNPGMLNAPKIYAMGCIFGKRWALTEFLPTGGNEGGELLRKFYSGNNARLSHSRLEGGFQEFFNSAQAYTEKLWDCVCIDLHSGNYRYRTDGSIVITDPFS